jgi:hypothetical protein
LSEAALQEHLRLASQRAKAYTNEKLVEFNEAIVGALEEMADAKVNKVSGATAGNIATFDASGSLTDSSAVRPITSAEMTGIINSVFGGNS